MVGITTIVFDLGGVIVDLDLNRTRQEFEKLGLLCLNDDYLKPANRMFSDYETGKISDRQFLDQIKLLSVRDISDHKIITAWNSMLLRIPPNRIECLKTLRKHYKLYVLSNTNNLHVEHFEKMVDGYNSLSQFFDAVYYSHILGYRKPEKEIFLALIEKTNIQPRQTLFIDDRIDNLKTAQSLGFKTMHIGEGEEFGKKLGNE